MNDTNEERKRQMNAYKALVKSDAVAAQMSSALDRADPNRVQRIIGLMLNAGVKSPLLYASSRESVLKVMMDCVAYGIEPNGRDAYVIPYKSKGGVQAQLIISYMGMITLCHKSERIAKVEAEVVRRGDTFTWRNGEVDHTIDWFDDNRGGMAAVYAKCTYKDGNKHYAILTAKEVEAIRLRSKSPNEGPWATDYEEMAKKTAVRRLSKYLPLSPDAAAAIAAEEDYVDAEDVRTAPMRKRASASEILADVAPVSAIEDSPEVKAIDTAASADAIPMPM